MRILFYSNLLTLPSAYGQQMKALLPRLQAAGHDVALLGWPGLAGGLVRLEGIPIFAGTPDYHSQQSVALRCQQFHPDVLVSLMDCFVLQPNLYPNVRHVPFFPVDTDTLRPADARVLSSAWDRIAFSKHAQEVAGNAGFPSRYIPLGIDTNVFKPLDKASAREFVGLPQDAFIVGMVAMNSEGWPTRKAWHENLTAFRLFLDAHPQLNPILYLHTVMHGGTDLAAYINALGLTDRVICTPQQMMQDGLTQEQMSILYNSFDVLLAVSKGEGACLPVIESQACGTVVVTGGWTATKENSQSGACVSLSVSGAVMEPALGPESEGCFRYRPQPSEIARALDMVASWSPEERIGRGQCGVDFAAQFNFDNLIPQWQQTIAEWEGRIIEETTGSRLRPKVDLSSPFDDKVHRASVTQAEVVIVTPSFGEKCGIAEYAKYQLSELFKAGYRAHIASTVAEACQIARRLETVKSVIVHHEYSLFDDGNPQLSRGEQTPIVLRQLRSLMEDKPDLRVGIVQHTVSPYPQHTVFNKLLAESGVPLFATSLQGARFLSETTGKAVGHCALGTWSIPGWNVNQFDDESVVHSPKPKLGGLSGETEPFTIGNFGKLGAQRDIPQMIEVCKRTNSRVMGSFECYNTTIQNGINKAFADNGVTGRMHYDWASDVGLMERLSTADIFYMPRLSSHFYSSASVIQAMNARRPIIANNDNGYLDLTDALCIAENADEAVRWVERLRDPVEYALAVSRIDNYVAERNVVSVLKGCGLIQ